MHIPIAHPCVSIVRHCRRLDSTRGYPFADGRDDLLVTPVAYSRLQIGGDVGSVVLSKGCWDFTTHLHLPGRRDRVWQPHPAANAKISSPLSAAESATASILPEQIRAIAPITMTRIDLIRSPLIPVDQPSE